MGLSTVSWLGNDWMGANVVGNGHLTRVFAQISMIWSSLLFGLTVDRIELPALNKPNQNRYAYQQFLCLVQGSGGGI